MSYGPRVGVVYWTVAIGTLLAAPAAAQSVQLDQYRMAETSVDGYAVSRPNDVGHLSVGARLDVDYVWNSLILQHRSDDPDGGSASLVEHHLAGNLSLGFGLFDRLILFAGLPVNLLMEGELVDGQPRADGTSLGDLWFGARGRLFGEKDDLFALSLQATATAPTARAARFQSRFAGEGSWTIHPELLMELRLFDVVRVTTNTGVRVRERQDFGSLEVRSELTWGLAVAGTLIPEVLDVTAESWGATSLFDFGHPPLTPVELVAGVQVHPVAGMTLGAAAGTGLSRGYGAGEFRAIVSVGYATPGEQPPGDRDGDGITDDVDRCPEEPEDSDHFQDEDGCPDRDNDGDGLDDAEDECPDQPEDHDGLGDEDGCPEDDYDDDGATDETDRCPTEPGIALAPRPECTGCPTCEETPAEPVREPPPERSLASEPGQLAERVFFEEGTYALRPSELPALLAVRDRLQANPDMRVLVEGHADQRGTDAENRILSRNRARRVMRWLSLHGIEPSRMVGAGCGEAYPENDAVTRAARRVNRRVEFYVGPGSSVRPGCEATSLSVL